MNPCCSHEHGNEDLNLDSSFMLYHIPVARFYIQYSRNGGFPIALLA